MYLTIFCIPSFDGAAVPVYWIHDSISNVVASKDIFFSVERTSPNTETTGRDLKTTTCPESYAPMAKSKNFRTMQKCNKLSPYSSRNRKFKLTIISIKINILPWRKAIAKTFNPGVQWLALNFLSVVLQYASWCSMIDVNYSGTIPCIGGTKVKCWHQFDIDLISKWISISIKNTKPIQQPIDEWLNIGKLLIGWVLPDSNI